MGMVDTAFGVFCEGLGSNTRLQVLDLRNNQITHDAATDIASALRRNTTLRVLGVWWTTFPYYKTFMIVFWCKFADC